MLWTSLLHVNITLDCIPIGQKFTCFSMSMAKILLTGFEPFGDNSTNISQQILNIFDTTLEISDPWYAARNNMSGKENISLVVEKQLLTVDEVGSKIVANRIINGSIGTQLFTWACANHVTSFDLKHGLKILLI